MTSILINADKIDINFLPQVSYILINYIISPSGNHIEYNLLLVNVNLSDVFDSLYDYPRDRQ